MALHVRYKSFGAKNGGGMTITCGTMIAGGGTITGGGITGGRMITGRRAKKRRRSKRCGRKKGCRAKNGGRGAVRNANPPEKPPRAPEACAAVMPKNAARTCRSGRAAC